VWWPGGFTHRQICLSCGFDVCCHRDFGEAGALSSLVNSPSRRRR
jgi:hypothetical protein